MSKIRLETCSVAARTAWCAKKEEKEIAAAEISVIKLHVTTVEKEMLRMESQTHQRMLLFTLERHFGVQLNDPRSTAGITLQRKKTVTFGNTKLLSILMRK